jgi:hypothetical protein
MSDRLQGSSTAITGLITGSGGLASPATVSQPTPSVEGPAISTTSVCNKIHDRLEGACEAACSAGRLATNVAQYHGQILRVLELVNGLRGPKGKESYPRHEASPDASSKAADPRKKKRAKRAKESRHRREASPDASSGAPSFFPSAFTATFREAQRQHLLTHREMRSWHRRDLPPPPQNQHERKKCSLSASPEPS